MPVLNYWDPSGSYVMPLVQGAQGAVGAPGAAGVFPTDTIQPALQNVWTGSVPPAGTRIKLCFTHGTATPDANGKITLTFSTFGWTFSYGYIPVLTGGSPGTGGGVPLTGFTASETGASLTGFSAYAFNTSGTALTVLVHYMLWVVGA